MKDKDQKLIWETYLQEGSPIQDIINRHPGTPDEVDPMQLDDDQFMEWMKQNAGPDIPEEVKDRYIQITIGYAAGDSGELSWSGVPGQP